MNSWVVDHMPIWGWLLTFAGIFGIPGIIVLLFFPALIPAIVETALKLWNALPSWARWLLGGLAGALIAYLAGRNQGHKNEVERQRQRNLRAEENRSKVDASVAGRTEKQQEQDWKSWQRD